MTLKKINGKSGEWDSELLVPSTVENAILRITLRLELRNHDGETFELQKRDENGRRVDGAKTMFDTRPWAEAEWSRFRERVKYLCEKHWNDQFWLEPPCDYAGLDVPYSLHKLASGAYSTAAAAAATAVGSNPPPTHRPNVKCEIRVQLVPGPKGSTPHRTITVLRLDEGQTAIRHSARLWDHTVVDWRWTANDGKLEKQLPVVHEVGHLLRLFHPGVGIVEGCTEQDNSQPKCYCVDEWCGELLGAGMVLTDRLARPWQKSMQDHTGIDFKRWRVLRVDRPPTPIGRINRGVHLGAAGVAFSG
jgi:hypothetical protein